MVVLCVEELHIYIVQPIIDLCAKFQDDRQCAWRIIF